MEFRAFALLSAGILLLALGSCPLWGADQNQTFHRLDMGLSYSYFPVLPSSRVQVRENNIQGTDLKFSDLGLSTVKVPQFEANVWFNPRHGLNLQIRDFAASGDHTISEPVAFNGAIVASGQNVNTRPSPWYSLALYYRHHFQEADHRRWGMDGLLGVEYTYLNFVIGGGHAPVTPDSSGTETKEDFYMQELPLPTLAFVVRREWPEVGFESSVKGNWINHWNSQRKEGGTVWLSQSGFEARIRFYFHLKRIPGLSPLMGVSYYYFRQDEESNEDGNLIEWSSWGPELGLRYSFGH